MCNLPAIKTAGESDLDRLQKLSIEFRTELGRTVPSDQDLRGDIRDLLSADDAEFFVAQSDDGNGVGFIQQRYRYSMWVSGLEACLEDLFVTSSCRRQGLARSLVEFAVARGQSKGCQSMVVDTNERNEAAVRLYTQLGFSSRSTGWPGGKQLWLRKEL